MMTGAAVEPRKKMPGKPAVSNPSLGFCRSVEFSMRRRAGAVVADEEDGAAALVRVVVAR